MDTKNSMTTKTSISVVANVCNILQSQLPVPCLKKDRLATTISEEKYKLGFEACKHKLHGNILCPKGFSPLRFVSIRVKLSI